MIFLFNHLKVYYHPFLLEKMTTSLLIAIIILYQLRHSKINNNISFYSNQQKKKKIQTNPKKIFHLKPTNTHREKKIFPLKVRPCSYNNSYQNSHPLEITLTILYQKKKKTNNFFLCFILLYKPLNLVKPFKKKTKKKVTLSFICF